MRFCFVVADASRARIYSVAPTYPDEPGRAATLDERADLVSLERRRPVGESLSDHPGVSHSPSGVGFGLDDHREDRTREVDRRFATDIVTRVASIVTATDVGRVVIIASPRMLGILRQVAPPLLKAVEREELALDLTRLTTPQLHDRLAELGLVPARERLAAH